MTASGAVVVGVTSSAHADTAASPLSSVFWGYLTAEKILDKNGQGQLCLGTLSEGLQEPDRIDAEVGKG